MDQQTSVNSRHDRFHRVRIGEQAIARSLAESDPASWQQHLQRAYVSRTSPPMCLCNPRDPVPMYVARLGETYVLKRRPNTGHLHQSECESHGGISSAAHLIYTDTALIERPDGKVNHSLSVPLSTIKAVNDSTLDEAAAPPRPTSATPKRNTMTLRGFMNLLWEEAGLACWVPAMRGKRTLTRVYWRLRNELVDRLIAGEDASQRVFVPTGFLNNDSDQRTREELLRRFDTLQDTHFPNQRPILLIVGELRSVRPTARNVAIRLKGLPDTMPIWTPPVSLERMRSQWTAAMARFERQSAAAVQPNAQERPNRLFIIAGIQLDDHGGLQWRYGAAMETTEDFIPIDSQYEARIANALAAQERHFRKPLRYDGEAATFADFVLTDMPKDVPMEIYGYSSPEYETRKREKIAHYQRQGESYWQWDVAQSKLPPPFPTNRKQ